MLIFQKFITYLIGNFAFFIIFSSIIKQFTDNKVIILTSSIAGLIVWNITCLIELIETIKNSKKPELSEKIQNNDTTD